MAKGSEDKGTVLRGADGALYFIPEDSLESFRLEDSDAGWARDAMRVADKERSSISSGIQDIYRWTNLELRLETALSGVTKAAVASETPTKVG